ncbi:hypothetical protein PENSPDRAFT_741426 [Peniophora sp. CONT]|nr:hypothetical protein PENSPDRAFT_741426 [Peniophora sp. CONT]
MARRTSSAFDYSIAYDDGERSRAALERNLQNTELSLHLSSHPSEDYSVEFPRHNSGPQPSFSNFRSIEYSYDGEHDGQHDESSHVNAWSYRTLDEEEGITHPTMSTAAHHASALTISAGLGGRAGHRRREDISLSGAEYDPERPLDHLVANLSALDADDTRSRTQNHYEQRPQRQTRAAPSASSSASDSSSGPATPPAGSPRGNLSAHLAHLTFSPKRPRSPAHAKSRSTTHAHRAQSPLQTHDDPTPRARKVRSSSSTHAHGHAHLQPEINVRPPTPSTADSKFTRMARSLARDIEAAQADGNLAQSTLRGGNKGLPTQQPQRRAEDVYGYSRGDGYSRTGVHLPDVTGLTAAVETPLKGGLRHYPYKDDGRADIAGKARLVEMLGLVQSRLLQLEGENAGAARRMRELEAELESCRADVASERARMLRRESEQDEILRRVESANTKFRAENERSKRQVVEGEQRRYREAVEEKKALEQLIGTLRGHMARLTDELAGQQGLLDELRGMREADASTLHDKVREVDHLRTEVERVAGEVEVLKGFVEEGLRERRARHPDASQIPLPSEEEEEEESERERSPSPAPTEPLTDDELAAAPRSPVQNRNQNQTYDDSQSLYYAPPPPVADRTTRTDRATVDTSRPSPRPYVEQSEIDRIAEELSERRSASRSGSLAGSMSSAAPSRQGSRPGSVLSGSGSRRVASPTPAPARPTAPTPAHAAGQHQQQAPIDDSPVPQRPRRSKDKGKHRANPNAEQETPFPQIRGERLEKLFFSAPAHNARTCAVCARRSGSKKSKQPLWSRVPSGSSRPRTQARGEEEVDEGFEEGSDADNHSVSGSPTSHESPNLDFLRPGARLPPQTVLVRVLRELEDDFTHYKGIYLELAQQYGLMDPVSNVAKRNVLAEHLKEVIDVLEQRGDQIASLYDLLTYEDKPDTKGKQTRPESRAARPESRATGSRKHAVFV